MKINRINTYILVCLLASLHWNILVPVKGLDILRRGSTQSTGSDSHVVSGDRSTDSNLSSGTAADGSTSGGSSGTSGGISGLLSKIPGFGSSSNSNSEESKEESGSTSSGTSDTGGGRVRWSSSSSEGGEQTSASSDADASSGLTSGKAGDNASNDPDMPTSGAAEGSAPASPTSPGGTDSTNTNGVDLNIKSDTKSTEKFDYKKEGNYVIYTAKGGNAFKHVKDDDATIWEAEDDSNCSNRVEVEFLANDGKAATIHLAGNNTKVFKKSGKNEPWNEIDTTKVTRGSTNINYPNESYFYKNEFKYVRTFTAKKGFVFNVAFEYINGKKVEIWKTENESEYAKKIVNEGNKIAIHLADGSTKVIEKGTDGKWPEDSEPAQNLQDKKQKAKIFFTDLNNVVNELSQGIDGTNYLAELDSRMREAAYKLSVELSKFLKLL